VYSLYIGFWRGEEDEDCDEWNEEGNWELEDDEGEEDEDCDEWNEEG